MDQHLTNYFMIKNGSRFWIVRSARQMRVISAWNARHICPISFRASFTNEARASMHVIQPGPFYCIRWWMILKKCKQSSRKNLLTIYQTQPNLSKCVVLKNSCSFFPSLLLSERAEKNILMRGVWSGNPGKLGSHTRQQIWNSTQSIRLNFLRFYTFVCDLDDDIDDGDDGWKGQRTLTLIFSLAEVSKKSRPRLSASCLPRSYDITLISVKKIISRDFKI